MDFKPIIRELAHKNIAYAEDEPMSRHTSFHIGGSAAIMSFPKTIDELKLIYSVAYEYGIPVFTMGNGSNLLASDEALNMLVVKMFDSFSAIELKNEEIYALSGTLLSRIAVFAQQNGLTGFEFAHGIPGTLGGAVFMNAGAYDGEIKDVVIETEYLDKELKQKCVRGNEHDFAYRHSVFSSEDSIILASKIKLCMGDRETIRAKMNELTEKRKASQPLNIPSAGSTFKRPRNGYAAAMIEQAGLKGFSVGGAQVSEKHAGFIVNKGGATCNDVLRLIEHVQERVFKCFGTELEPEIRIVKNGV